MSTLIQQLVAIREAQKLTQSALSDLSGLSRMTIVRIEHAQIDPRLSSVLVMARALGLDLVLVPKELKQPLEEFIQAGGKYLGQAQGIDAPRSIVDSLLTDRGIA